MNITEEQNNCHYCHKKNKALTRSLINTSSLSLLIEGNVLKVPNCPMCGRSLIDNE